LTQILKLSIDGKDITQDQYAKDPDYIKEYVFQTVLPIGWKKAILSTLPLGENPRVKSLKNKERFTKDKEGKPFPKLSFISSAMVFSRLL